MMLLASSLVSYAPAVPTIGSRVAAVQMHYNHDQEVCYIHYSTLESLSARSESLVFFAYIARPFAGLP